MNKYVRLNFDPIGGANTAAGVSFDNSGTSLSATNVQAAIVELDGDIQSEAAARLAADTLLQTNITNEVNRATAAENALDDKIDQEILDRQAADALLIPLSQKGQPNGVATLDGSGLVPASQLPSYVDDVLEFPNFSAFPAVGETGKIYIAQDTNFQYRWSGSAYFQLSVSPVSSVFGRTGAVVAQNGDYTASQVTNVPAGNLAAITVQGALNELQTDIDTRALQSDLALEVTNRQSADLVLQDNIDAEETARIAADNALQADINTRALETNLQAEILRATGAETALQDAIDQEIADRIAADLVLQGNITTVQSNLTAHINDATDAHTASAITNVPAGNLTATNLQDAVNELQTQIDNTVSGVSSVFGRTGAVVAVSGDYSADQVTFDGTTSGLTATEVQGAIDELAARPVGAPGDITLTDFNFASSQTGADVTGLLFNPANIRSFEVLLSIETPTLFQSVTLYGIQKSSDFFITEISRGDESGVTFDITSAGQVTYSSGLETGTIKFRAIIT